MTVRVDGLQVKPRPQSFKPLTEQFRLVAEVGGCNASLDWAKDAALAARDAGFWALKVQMLQRDTLTTRKAPTYGGVWEPKTQWETFTEHGLDEDAWAALKSWCDHLGLVFFASVWDEASASMAVRLGCPLLKIGSADITHEWLLRFINNLGTPVILSTGGSHLWEVDQAVGWLRNVPVALAACTLSYPCDVPDANLGRIGALKRSFTGRVVGYSDHCREPWIVGEAKKAGAAFVEVHWTVTPGEGGDHDFALHPGNVDQMQDGAQDWNGDMFGSPVFTVCDAELKARRFARRSYATSRPVSRGERWTSDMLCVLRPGTGVEPYRLSELVGKPVLRDYGQGETLDRAEAE